MEILTAILAAAVRSGTPILYATLGEIITQRAGIMNLGLEGLMLIGAFSGFAVTWTTGLPWLGVAVAFLAGALFVVPHAFLSITLGANQVVSGLALTMLGMGISALMGLSYVGETIVGLTAAPLPLLSKIPLLGDVLFNHDPLVYLSYLLTILLCIFLWRTRPGLELRATGDAPRSADSAGIPVMKLRYLYTLLGGGIVAVGGALPFYLLQPHVDRRHDSWTRLDCRSSGDFCHLASGSGGTGGLSLRQRRSLPTANPGHGHQHSSSAAPHVALHSHYCGPDAHCHWQRKGHLSRCASVAGHFLLKGRPRLKY